MFEDFKNEIDFFIRNKTKFSKKNFIEKDEKVLEINKAQNKYFKEIFERYFFKNKKDNLQILDIGSKNWFYAKSMHEFFSSFSSNFTLDGVEIDGYRLYSNLYSRFEVAKYYIKDLKNTNYIVDDLLNINKKYDYITWFLPFVTIEPHRAWGLPEKYFNPEEMFNHALSLLNPSGQMLIINQGEKEKDIQKQMLINSKTHFEFLGEIKNEFYQFDNKRYGFIVRNFE